MYHLRCFTCSLCSKQLSTGEVLYLQPGEEGFVCKDHYLNKGKTKSKATYISDNTSLDMLEQPFRLFNDCCTELDVFKVQIFSEGSKKKLK